MISRFLVGALLCVCCVAVIACSAETTPERVDVYTVRGQIVDTPSAGGSVRIRHEAIADFKVANGEVSAMDSMVMPFQLDESLAAVELAIGDKVQFELTIRWRAPHPMKVTDIEGLPPETELVFDKANVSH